MRKVRGDAEQGLQTCKFCALCEHWHPVAEFYVDRAKPDGLRAYCKSCDIARSASGTRKAVPQCGRCKQVLLDCTPVVRGPAKMPKGEPLPKP